MEIKMESFLTSTANKLRAKNYAELTLVLGNESCDLDSAVSSLVYAAFLYWQYLQIKCKVCTRLLRDAATKEDIFVPILNVARQDFELKTEVAFYLNDIGINESMLVFRDDYDYQELLRTASKASVVLVDHHILAKKDRFFQTHVTEIIDHRPMDAAQWNYSDTIRSTIELVGSCSTLVAKRVLDLAVLLGRDNDWFAAHRLCAEMLHSAIILDTVNFSKEVNKATPQDEDMVLMLESKLKPENYGEFRKCKLERLVEARKDVSGLTAGQLMRKDVKIAGDILVPSFPILVEEFLHKPGASQAVLEALESEDCNLAVLLGMCLNKELKRDAAVYLSTNPERANKLSQHLQAWSTPSLQLEAVSLAYAPDFAYFKQNNLSASRKQYMPALNDFLERKL